MKSFGGVWLAIKSLFYTFTGLVKKPVGYPPESEALAAIFMPLMGLAAGLVAASAAVIVQKTGLYAAAVIAGLAVVVLLGGFKQITAVSSFFPEKHRVAGAATVAVLVLLFETFAIYEAAAYRINTLVFTELLYLPVAWAVGMMSAASATKEEGASCSPLARVKGGHMLLSCALAFVLMLPQFGLASLALIASSVLSGAVSALALRKKNNGGEAAYIAALAAGLLYCVLFMLLNKPIIYY